MNIFNVKSEIDKNLKSQIGSGLRFFYHSFSLRLNFFFFTLRIFVPLKIFQRGNVKICKTDESYGGRMGVSFSLSSSRNRTV